MPELGQASQAQPVEVQSQTTQSNPPDASKSNLSNPQKEENDDGWGKAKEAWDLGGDVESSENLTEPKTAENGQTESHIEADQGNKQPEDHKEESLKLSEDEIFKVDLNNIWETPVKSENGGPEFLPHKYRNLANQKINAILADTKAHASKLVEGYQESNSAFAKAFVEVLQSENPLQTLTEYAKEIAPVFRLPEEVVTKLSQKAGGQNTATPQNEVVGNTPSFNHGQIQQLLDQKMTEVEDKYWPLLETETDPRKTRELWSKMEKEKLFLQNAVNEAKQKALLSNLISKVIKPQMDKLGEIEAVSQKEKDKAIFNSKVSLWDSAQAKMSQEYPDFQKYYPKIKELLKSRYGKIRDEVNETGKGHFESFKDLYLLVSRNDQLEAAKQPKLGSPGLKPTGTHIKTLKPGGSDWADIKKEYWGDIIQPA